MTVAEKIERVLRRRKTGMTAKELADRLLCSPNTVHQAARKLGDKIDWHLSGTSGRRTYFWADR